MTRIHSLVFFVAALLLAAGFANAADVAPPHVQMPMKAAAAEYGWNGFYLGATAGGALQNTVIDDKDCNLSCSSQNLNGSGFTAGVTAGWNYQFGHGVIGIEGDLDWDNFKATFSNPAWPSYHSAKWDGFGTVRARAGVAFDRVLMYATGGLAFVKIDDFGRASPDVCDNVGCFSVSGVQTGIAAGAGVEYALSGPWSVKGEYLYVALPSKSTHDLVRTSSSSTYNVLSDAHILRLGLNYNFSGHPATAPAPAESNGFAAAGAGWTGFYAGVVGGYGLQNAVIDDKNCNLSCSSWSMNGSGFTVGGTAGWNYQFGRGLVGVEADLDWADFKASYSDPVWVGVGSNHSEQWKWFSTLRGRAGVVAGRSLLYVTGGLALVDADYTGQSGGGCGSRGCFSISGVTPGLAAGFGTEYALTGNWSAKGEYLYVDLPGKRTHDLVRTDGFSFYNARSDAHIVRVGLNYHASPVGTADPAPAPKLPQWNGLYVGASGGGALQNTVFDDKSCFFSCSSQNLNGSGFTAGGTAGWNHQLGSAVFGVEGDFNWAGFRQNLVDPNWAAPRGSVHSAEWKWFATARARGGVVVDRALIYATAGFAFVDVDESIQFTTGCDCFALSGVRTGIAAGVGAEYALAGPWSVKGEYLYVGLPTKHLTDNLAPGNTEFTANVKSEAHIVRGGLNYHFN